MKDIVAILAMVKAPRCGLGSRPIIHRLADLRLNELKAALADVCALRVLLVF